MKSAGKSRFLPALCFRLKRQGVGYHNASLHAFYAVCEKIVTMPSSFDSAYLQRLCIECFIALGMLRDKAIVV